MEEWYATLSCRCSRGMISGETICEQILRTAREMIGDRGFQTTAPIAEMKRNVAAGQTTRFSNNAGRACVLFFDREERTGVKTVRTLMEQHPDTAIVVVALEGATPFTRREMANVRAVDFFRAKELIHNVTRHHLVPTHEAVRPEDVEQIQQTYCVADDQWPVILTTDPVVRWFAWPVGTIIRIHRNGLTQDAQIFFRKVVTAGG